MRSNPVIISKNYVIFAALIIVMIAGMLVWILNLRLAAFTQHQNDTTREALTGVEKQVAFYVAEKQRMVGLFVHENINLITAFAKTPDNDSLRIRLAKQLSLYFPDRFSFTIADANGVPLFEDFDGLVSALCLSDIKQFTAQQQTYHPYIHPNSEGYHFDVMVRYGKGAAAGVFFVSFLADVLGEIIQTIQGPYQKIMLVYPQRSELIEVIAEGARNNLPREDYRLSAVEREGISMRRDIAGTRWQAVAFDNRDLYIEHRNKLIWQLSVVFMLFLAVVVLFILRLGQEESQRELGEEQRKALMSVVSHEFRSPTTVIKAALEQVESGMLGPVEGDVKKFVQMALKSSNRLLLLVDDFVDIQTIESGNLKLDKKPTELKMLVLQTVANNQLYAEQFGTRYHIHEPLLDDYVSCDESRIEQVMTNLLTNAVKYGEENGIVNIGMSYRKNFIRVSVSNKGAGIPAEFHDKVFEKFAMAYAPKKEQKIKSSGLGLSIAREIIAGHGGHIGFDSVPDDTTTFWFELRIAK